MSSDSKIKITSDHCDTSDSDDLENENDQYRSYFLQGKSELDKIIGKYDEYSDDEILEDKPEVDAIFHDILENIGDDTLIYPLGEILSTVSPYALVNPHEMKFVLDSGTRVISWKDGKIIGLVNFNI